MASNPRITRRGLFQGIASIFVAPKIPEPVKRTVSGWCRYYSTDRVSAYPTELLDAFQDRVAFYKGARLEYLPGDHTILAKHINGIYGKLGNPRIR